MTLPPRWPTHFWRSWSPGLTAIIVLPSKWVSHRQAYDSGHTTVSRCAVTVPAT